MRRTVTAINLGHFVFRLHTQDGRYLVVDAENHIALRLGDGVEIIPVPSNDLQFNLRDRHGQERLVHLHHESGSPTLGNYRFSQR